jgi:hypothetical protein
MTLMKTITRTFTQRWQTVVLCVGLPVEGAKNRLPTAEYNLPDTDIGRSEVLKRAKAAAESVKPSPTPWIVVTESAGRSWSGLKSWRD